MRRKYQSGGAAANWKNHSDQTYSCPERLESRLQLGGPLKPPVHDRTIVLGDIRGARNWTRIMPRDITCFSQTANVRFLSVGAAHSLALHHVIVGRYITLLWGITSQECKEIRNKINIIQ